MQTRLTLKPGQKGTKALQAEYGDRLVCVRYKYDASRRKRYKTVELVVEARDWMPNGSKVWVKVAWGEAAIGRAIRNAGGVWNQDKKLWKLTFKEAVALGLADRVVSPPKG